MGGGASARKKGFQGAVAGSFSYDGVVISVNFSEQGLYEDEKVYVLWLNPMCFLVNDEDPWELALFVYNLQKGALYRIMNKFHRHALLGLYDDSQLFRRGMFVAKQKLPFMKRKTGKFEGLEIGEAASDEPTIDGKTGVAVQWVNPFAFRTKPNGVRPPELWVYVREKDAYMVVTQCERPVSDAQTNPKKVRRRMPEEPVAPPKSDEGEDVSDEEDDHDDNSGAVIGAKAEKIGEEREGGTAAKDMEDAPPPPKDADTIPGPATDTENHHGDGGDHKYDDRPHEVPPDPVDQEGADVKDGGGDSAEETEPPTHPSEEGGEVDGAARLSVSGELPNSGFEAEPADALPRAWRPFEVVKGRFLRDGCTHTMHVIGRGVKYGGRRADIEWLSPFVFWFEQKSDNELRMCIYLCEHDSYMVVHDPSCSLASAVSKEALWKRTDGAVLPDLLYMPHQTGAFGDMNVPASGPVLLDGESFEAVWLNPCTFCILVEGAMQIWTYSMQDKAYLQLGEWESPVWSARNIPERKRHMNEAIGLLKAHAEPPAQENAHRDAGPEHKHDGRRDVELSTSEGGEEGEWVGSGEGAETGNDRPRHGVSGGVEPRESVSERVQAHDDDDDDHVRERVDDSVRQEDVPKYVGNHSQQLSAPGSMASDHDGSGAHVMGSLRGVGVSSDAYSQPESKPEESDHVEPDAGVSQHVEGGEHVRGDEESRLHGPETP